MENTQNQENEAAQNLADQKHDIIDIVAQNTKVEIILNILSQINWSIIDQMIDSTPEDLKDQISYQVLFEAREFNNQIGQIFNNQN